MNAKDLGTVPKPNYTVTVDSIHGAPPSRSFRNPYHYDDRSRLVSAFRSFTPGFDRFYNHGHRTETFPRQRNSSVAEEDVSMRTHIPVDRLWRCNQCVIGFAADASLPHAAWCFHKNR
jgi:hypothetical protein